MEDSHIACLDLGDGSSIFGVFDGHGGILNYLNYYMLNNIWLLGKEVALYVKDKYVAELKKLNSFKQKDYPTALKESFIKIDELLRSPAGLRDILKYQTTTETTS